LTSSKRRGSVNAVIQSLHDAVEKRVADFVGIASSQLPMRVPAALSLRISEMRLAVYGVGIWWERLQTPIIVHVGNLKGSFYTMSIASSPDVRHRSVEYTVSGYIHLEESRMSESASSQSAGQEVEFREGCPSVDHVEAALRLGLSWEHRGRSERYRFVVNKGIVCADFPPLVRDADMAPYDRFVDKTQSQFWRPYDAKAASVAWSVLDAEVARFKTTQVKVTPTSTPSPPTTQRFNVGDAVICSTFADGTAGVRIACASDIARNLGVGKIEGCWQDHSRYRVRNLGTDEVHIWPASALQGVENWGLKVGDEVVTPRFGGAQSCGWVSSMEVLIDKAGVVHRFENDGAVRVHGWLWPTYDVAVATAKAKLRKSVEAASSQPTPQSAPAQKPVEFRQLTRGIIEANPYQIWQCEGAPEGRFDKYRYVDGMLRSDYMSRSVSWDSSSTLLSCPPNEAYLRKARPVAAATKLPMSWDELKPSLDEAKPLTLPRDGDPVTVESAVAIAEEGARRALKELREEAKPISFTTPGRFVHNTTQEITMPTINTGTAAPTTDNPTMKKPSRGRLAIDAAKTRAPVELGLNRMHKIVAKKALKMFKGTRQEKAVVQRFLSDILQSEYGKAFMGAAAATIVPYGASLPGLGKHADTLDAVADELAKRSATVLAVELGGTLLDAVEPLIAIVSDMVAKTAEGGGVEVVDMPAEAARLSAPQQSSPDFSGSITASSMRCRTSA